MSRQSKFLSFILRHKPEELGLKLNRAGWAQIELLLRAMKKTGRPMSRDELQHLVENNDKSRFAISADGEFIRAVQGHSIDVDLGLGPHTPPEHLYHGTARQNHDSIFSEGLRPMGRRQVHLSVTPSVAEAVGRRHGKPVVLQVATLRMHEMGHLFFVADDGVWLTDIVPVGFLSFWNSGE